MAEIPVSFSVNQQTLRGTLHQPQGVSKAPGVLFLHDFDGHRLGPNGLFVAASRHLAEAGLASLRFDFRGRGESDGADSALTIRSQSADARAALAFLRRQPGIDGERLAIVGFGLGAAIASQLADEPDVRAMVFWSPLVFTVPIFARMGLYAAHPELGRRGWIDAGGLKVGRDFLAELPALDPLGALAEWQRPLLVLYGKEDTQATAENAEALLSEVPGARGLCLPQGTHAFGTVAARDWLLEHTLAALKPLGAGLPVLSD